MSGHNKLHQIPLQAQSWLLQFLTNKCLEGDKDMCLLPSVMTEVQTQSCIGSLNVVQAKTIALHLDQIILQYIAEHDLPHPKEFEIVPEDSTKRRRFDLPSNNDGSSVWLSYIQQVFWVDESCTMPTTPEDTLWKAMAEFDSLWNEAVNTIRSNDQSSTVSHVAPGSSTSTGYENGNVNTATNGSQSRKRTANEAQLGYSEIPPRPVGISHVATAPAANYYPNTEQMVQSYNQVTPTISPYQSLQYPYSIAPQQYSAYDSIYHPTMPFRVPLAPNPDHLLPGSAGLPLNCYASSEQGPYSAIVQQSQSKKPATKKTAIATTAAGTSPTKGTASAVNQTTSSETSCTNKSEIDKSPSLPPQHFDLIQNPNGPPKESEETKRPSKLALMLEEKKQKAIKIKIEPGLEPPIHSHAASILDPFMTLGTFNNSVAGMPRSEDYFDCNPKTPKEERVVPMLRQMGFTDMKEILMGIRNVLKAHDAEDSMGDEAVAEATMIEIVREREEAAEREKMDEMRIHSEEFLRQEQQQKQSPIDAIIRSPVKDIIGTKEYYNNRHDRHEKEQVQNDKELKMSATTASKSIHFPTSIILESEKVFHLFYDLLSNTTTTIDTVDKPLEDQAFDPTTARTDIVHMLSLEKKSLKWYGCKIPHAYFHDVLRQRLEAIHDGDSGAGAVTDVYTNTTECKRPSEEEADDHADKTRNRGSMLEAIRKESSILENAMYMLSEQEEADLGLQVPKIFITARNNASDKSLSSQIEEIIILDDD